MNTKPYTPSRQLKINQERARKIQPALITPKGTGNWTQASDNYLKTKDLKL